MKIGQKLKFIRNLKGFTQKQVAKELNLERRNYANLESENTKIDMSRMSDIAKIYGIELHELLNFNENNAFTNCFNNNPNGLFNAKKIVSKTSKEEQQFFINQIKSLENLFSEERKSLIEERKVYMEMIVNLKNIIEKLNESTLLLENFMIIKR